MRRAAIGLVAAVAALAFGRQAAAQSASSSRCSVGALPSEPRRGTMPIAGATLSPEHRRILLLHVRRLAACLRLRETAVASLAARLAARNLTIDELVGRLETQAQHAADLQGELAQLRLELAQVADSATREPAEAALNRARTAFDAGQFEEAQRELRALAGLRSARSREALNAWVTAVRAQAQFAELRLDHADAERLLLAAADSDLREFRARQWDLKIEAALVRYREGELLGDSAALRRSLTLLTEEVLPLAERRERPLDWASTQNTIGNVLVLLGGRSVDDRGLLQRAVAAFEAAREVQSPERTPMEWAITHNNLGNAYQTLGEREHGTDSLERAAAAYEAALRVWTRANAPEDWALTQNNLAVVLTAIARRQRRREPLIRAEAALQGALQVWTRETLPLEWARAQNNLGEIYLAIGTLDNSSPGFLRALALFDEVLTVRRPDVTPYHWALTQNLRGIALTELGEREQGTRRLEEAIAAFEAALRYWTREDVEVAWAGVSVSMAHVRMQLAVRTRNRALLATARLQATSARAVLVAAGHDSALAFADHVLGRIGELERAMAR